MDDFNLSQSMWKAFWKYSGKYKYLDIEECGIYFLEKYIKKSITLEDEKKSEAMQLGIWFEFLCTGQRPKDGSTPTPKKTTKGELRAAYKLVEKQADNFKKYCATRDIKILDSGIRVEDNGFEGTLDIVAMYKGRKVIIDLKYTSKIDNKWDIDGWDLKSLEDADNDKGESVYFNHQVLRKEYMCLQARAYIYLYSLPFYFFLFSSKDEDCKLFEVIVDPDDKEVFKAEIEAIRTEIEWEAIKGFKARPSLTRCKECPLSSTCEHKTEAPIEEEPIYYTKTA